MTAGLPHIYGGPPLGDHPLVSICIPTFNRGELVQAAVESALAQTYERLEIVVVDDASDDDTVERVRSSRDTRVRFEVNPQRLGQAKNRNRTLALARGELVKFLDSDDVLDQRCVAAHVSLFEDEPRVGLAFSRRSILLDDQPGEDSQGWLRGHRDVHRSFSHLDRINDGRQLFGQWLAAGLHDNWIGEPSAVMVRRVYLERHGGFNPFVHQTVDADLWLRLLPHMLVGFIDEPLVTYRYGESSEHGVNHRTRRAWVDRLWTLESLASDLEASRAFPQIEVIRSQERRQAWRTAARLGFVPEGNKVPVGPYLQYIRQRLRTAGRPRARLESPYGPLHRGTDVHSSSSWHSCAR